MGPDANDIFVSAYSAANRRLQTHVSSSGKHAQAARGETEGQLQDQTQRQSPAPPVHYLNEMATGLPETAMIALSLENAQAIMDEHDEDIVVQGIKPIDSSSKFTQYEIEVDGDRSQSTFIVLFESAASFKAYSSLVATICTKSSVPLPSSLNPDIPRQLHGQPYLLLSCPSGPTLHSCKTLQPSDSVALLEKRLGAWIRELHLLDNDWFGIPTIPSEWSTCYSWQECFTLLLEQTFDDVREADISLPFDEQQLQRLLGRAIAFYLFDDVEVPSLIWNTSLEWAADIVLVADSAMEGGDIWVFRTLSNVMWGDPLMEGALRNPSEALLEGYQSNPITFGRQRTKRLWYTLYAALQLLLHIERRKHHSQIGVWDAAALRDLLLQTADALRIASYF